MTRTEYNKARQIFRENGPYGIRFLERKISAKVHEEFYTWYWNVHQTLDRLKERQDVVEYCKREKLYYNFRQIM